mmetsp:Transcript_113447/g.242123  ORF Transcript_113447/g.242123 Transcript_113447/m.242123 type:complete len:107 (-) Transcript_113447:513-833(-)
MPRIRLMSPCPLRLLTASRPPQLGLKRLVQLHRCNSMHLVCLGGSGGAYPSTKMLCSCDPGASERGQAWEKLADRCGGGGRGATQQKLRAARARHHRLHRWRLAAV